MNGIAGDGVERYFFYVCAGGRGTEGFLGDSTIDEDGAVFEGKCLFEATEDGAYRIALQRAKKYRKMNPGGATRFYIKSDDLPKKLSCFDCYGSVYRDTLRPFVKHWIGYICYWRYSMKDDATNCEFENECRAYKEPECEDFGYQKPFCLTLKSVSDAPCNDELNAALKRLELYICTGAEIIHEEGRYILYDAGGVWVCKGDSLIDMILGLTAYEGI
jgi:hypothetical protein